MAVGHDTGWRIRQQQVQASLGVTRDAGAGAASKPMATLHGRKGCAWNGMDTGDESPDGFGPDVPAQRIANEEGMALRRKQVKGVLVD